MKFLLIILSIILFFINPLKASDIKIVYIDTDKVLNESMVGKNVKKQLDTINKRNASKFEQIEMELIEEEKKISQQKNILSKEELKNKTKKLQKKAIKFKNDIKKNKNDLILKNNEATKKILDTLNPILSDFASKNSIQIILQKNLIVIGRGDLDITDEILIIINEKIKNIKLN